MGPTTRQMTGLLVVLLLLFAGIIVTLVATSRPTEIRREAAKCSLDGCNQCPDNGNYLINNITNCPAEPDGDIQSCNGKGRVGLCGGKTWCCPAPGQKWTTSMTACAGKTYSGPCVAPKTPTPTKTPLLTSTLTPSVCTSFSASAPTADANTLGLWHLDETSGNVIDSSGNNNTGTPTGTTVVSGVIRNGRSINGAAGSGINISELSSHSNFTLEAWAKLDSSASSYNVLVVTRDGGISYDATNGIMDIVIFADRNGGYSANPATQYRYTIAVTIPRDQWVYYAFVADSSNTGKLYINGTEISLGFSTTDGGVTGDYQSAIGALKLSTNVLDRSWKGVLDEVRISNVARSSAEISATYNSICLQTVSTPTPTNTPTPIPTPTPKQYIYVEPTTPKPTRTPTPTPTSYILNSCNKACSSNTDCPGGLTCATAFGQKVCRNPLCADQFSCLCDQGSFTNLFLTPTPTESSLGGGPQVALSVSSFTDSSGIAGSTPTITGLTEPGALITISIFPDGVSGTVTADASGRWSWRATKSLTPGQKSLLVVAKNASGAQGQVNQTFSVSAAKAGNRWGVLILILVLAGLGFGGYVYYKSNNP